MLSHHPIQLPQSFTVHVYVDGSTSPILARGKANNCEAWLETRRAQLSDDGMLEPARWLPVAPKDLTPLLQGMPADFEYVKTLGSGAFDIAR